MGLARYALGTLELGLLVLGAISAARTLRHKLVPGWRGPHSLLVTVVLALSVTCVVLQLLGAVSLLREWALPAAGLLLLAVTPRGLRPQLIRGSVWPREIPWRAGVALGLLGGLAVAWVVEIRGVVLHGVLDIDSLTYHLPFAQEWARSHRIGPLVHVAPGTPVQYYPGNDELLHASGLIAYGREVLGPYVNAAWLALLGLSAFALGLRRGRVMSLVSVVVIIAGGPLIAKFLPGGAMSDVASLAAVLAMAALQVEAFDTEDLKGGLAVAGAAAGLAVGIKLTVLPLLGAVTLALLAVRSVRGRPWLCFAGGLAVPAAFWYVRDLVLTGSPAPFVAVPGLPSPGFSLFDRNAQSVLHYATDGHVLTHYYLPLTYDVLGPAWWVLVLLAVAGVVAGLRSRRDPFVVLAVAAVVGGVAYLVTPTGAGGPEGKPFLFAVDVRYALPTVLLAVSLLPLLLKGRTALALDGVLVLAAGATLLAPWRLTTEIDQSIPVTLAVLLLVGIAATLKVPRPGRRTAIALGVVAVIGLYPLARLADERSYADARSPQAYHYFRDRTGLTVAVTGNLRVAPYTGRALGNEVHYLGRVTPDGGFEDFRSCEQWRAAAVRDHADAYVVDRFARGWVDDPAFVDLVPDQSGPRVVRLTGTPSPGTCPA